MKERPILFSAPMVRAIIEGRKTQTRRVIKPQPASGWAPESPPVLGIITSPHPKRGRFGVFIRRGLGTDFPEADLLPCPHGQPGDRLWVRETFYHDPEDSLTLYRADGGFDGDQCDAGYQWQPSIFMPRALSRILLEITAVRVERLQEISEEGAKAEGCEPIEFERDDDCGNGWTEYWYVGGFCRLWASINGPGAWATNPLVWVIEFKRVEQTA